LTGKGRRRGRGRSSVSFVVEPDSMQGSLGTATKRRASNRSRYPLSTRQLLRQYVDRSVRRAAGTAWAWAWARRPAAFGVHSASLGKPPPPAFLCQSPFPPSCANHHSCSRSYDFKFYLYAENQTFHTSRPGRWQCDVNYSGR
jgi:hypothetical protein